MIYLQMWAIMIDLGGVSADAVRRWCGVVVGRAVAGGGAGSARRSGPAGRAALGSGVAGADRDPLGAGAAGGQPVLRSGAAVAGFGVLRAADGDEAPLWLGVRDVDAGGGGLD